MIELKKTSGSTLTTPSATPVVLLKVLSRPLTNRKNCVGPTAPMVSGGNAPVSVGPVTVSKLVLMGWGAEGKSAAAITAFPVECGDPAAKSGVLATGFASGFCGRSSRPGMSCSGTIGGLLEGGAMAWACMISAVVR